MSTITGEICRSQAGQQHEVLSLWHLKGVNEGDLVTLEFVKGEVSDNALKLDVGGTECSKFQLRASYDTENQLVYVVLPEVILKKLYQVHHEEGESLSLNLLHKGIAKPTRAELSIDIGTGSGLSDDTSAVPVQGDTALFATTADTASVESAKASPSAQAAVIAEPVVATAAPESTTAVSESATATAAAADDKTARAAVSEAPIMGESKASTVKASSAAPNNANDKKKKNNVIMWVGAAALGAVLVAGAVAAYLHFKSDSDGADAKAKFNLEDSLGKGEETAAENTGEDVIADGLSAEAVAPTPEPAAKSTSAPAAVEPEVAPETPATSEGPSAEAAPGQPSTPTASAVPACSEEQLLSTGEQEFAMACSKAQLSANEQSNVIRSAIQHGKCDVVTRLATYYVYQSSNAAVADLYAQHFDPASFSASACFQQPDTAAAVRWYSKALELDPSNSAAQTRLEELQ